MIKQFLAFIGGLLRKKTNVDVAAPVQTANGTSQSTTVTESDAEIAEADVEKAIVIVNNVKKALSSPIAVLITDLIPTDIDNEIRETLVNDLPVVVAGLTFASGLLTGSDKSTQINALLANIKFSDQADLNAMYHTLAARILMIVTGGKVSWSNALMAVEYYFTHIFTNGNSADIAAVAVAPVAEETATK